MSRDKQIEEMTKDVTRSICWCNEEIPTVDGMGTAITLYNKGYRKSTDLAEEIFAEIDDFQRTFMTEERKQAIEALDRIHNYCEEIDYHCPEDQRTGYKMLPDVLLISHFLHLTVSDLAERDIPKARIAELKKKYIGKDTNVTTKESEDTE